MVDEPAARRRPGRPPRTDRTQIVDAALELVATTGLDGLTMSRTAKRVGLSEMGLYRHVASRDELIEFVVDAALARIVPVEVTPPDRPGEVRSVLVDLGGQLVRGLAAYPGVAAHLGLHGPTGPAGLGLMGAIMRLLARGGVPADLIPLAHAHYTATICSAAVFRQHATSPGVSTWGATARQRLAGTDWADDPELAGVVDRYTGAVEAYEHYAIGHAVDAVLADAGPGPGRSGSGAGRRAR